MRGEVGVRVDGCYRMVARLMVQVGDLRLHAFNRLGQRSPNILGCRLVQPLDPVAFGPAERR
ncbi:MAG TPA: hypothetical protein VK714_06030 [Myxococcota bacterium]|nr:hypothetical protein [Myxococcota bacterium]